MKNVHFMSLCRGDRWTMTEIKNIIFRKTSALNNSLMKLVVFFVVVLERLLVNMVDRLDHLMYINPYLLMSLHFLWFLNINLFRFMSFWIHSSFSNYIPRHGSVWSANWITKCNVRNVHSKCEVIVCLISNCWNTDLNSI